MAGGTKGKVSVESRSWPQYERLDILPQERECREGTALWTRAACAEWEKKEFPLLSGSSCS